MKEPTKPPTRPSSPKTFAHLLFRQPHQMQRGHYPASLDEPDLQPYLGEHVVTFLREGRVTYHPPERDSPPTFIIVHMTTPRGDYSAQLDGTPLYPTPK